jgi:hypothetical protein
MSAGSRSVSSARSVRGRPLPAANQYAQDVYFGLHERVQVTLHGELFGFGHPGLGEMPPVLGIPPGADAEPVRDALYDT